MIDPGNAKIELTGSDRILELLGWVIVVVMCCFTVWSYTQLPETIPIHFDGSGKPNGYGGRATIIILPAIGAVLFFGLTTLNRYPSMFNFPVELTPENVQQQYTLATRLVRVLKTIVVAIFTTILISTYATATGRTDGLGTWFLPVTMGFIFASLAYYIVKMFKAKKA